MPLREVVIFQNAPDFENPTDQDANNLYEVTVRASDGSLYDDQVISVSVTDVFENTSPSNLAAGSLTVLPRTNPVGTVVGEFNATDPEGGAISYHLVSGIGDGNNSLFTLDADGTLKTAVLFDYETNASSYAIRVEAKDEYNASVEGNFTVALSDVNDAPNFVIDNKSTVNLVLELMRRGHLRK